MPLIVLNFLKHLFNLNIDLKSYVLLSYYVKQSFPVALLWIHSALILSLIRFITMNRAWTVFKAHPYISNILGYTTLFASADLIQQSVLGGNHTAGSTSEDRAGIDWCQTARVATVGFCFHANFNYHWLRWLERMLPGGGVKAVTGKVVIDQLVAAPLTISAFYIGKCVISLFRSFVVLIPNNMCGLVYVSYLI